MLGSVACETDEEDEVVDCTCDDECERELASFEVLAGETDPERGGGTGTRSSKV